MALIPSGLSSPFSASVSGTVSDCAPATLAWTPAAAFHTPRAASVAAISPATAPLGAKSLI